MIDFRKSFNFLSRELKSHDVVLYYVGSLKKLNRTYLFYSPVYMCHI